MKDKSTGSGNVKQKKEHRLRINEHIPSAKRVLGCHGSGRRNSNQSKYVGDYPFVPTSKAIKKPILDTSKMARAWANGKIKTEMSEEI